MPCLLALMALAFPRLVLLLVWLFSGYLGNAIHSNFVGLLGFIFMPFTTLAYAWSVNTYGSVSGLGLVALILGVLLDFGLLGGASRAKRRPSQ